MYSLYRIGIEVEFMLKPLAVQFSASEKLRTIVDRIISACNPQLRASAQLRNRVDKSCSRPEHWSLKKDNSVIAYEWNAGKSIYLGIFGWTAVLTDQSPLGTSIADPRLQRNECLA